MYGFEADNIFEHNHLVADFLGQLGVFLPKLFQNIFRSPVDGVENLGLYLTPPICVVPNASPMDSLCPTKRSTS